MNIDKDLAFTLIRMMQERANYHFNLTDPKGTEGIAAAMAYDTCATLLEYALQGNTEAIAQYDYYGKENN